MSSSEIKIHEFSTGIRQRKTDDGWVSLGFTGKYMNMTMEVPEAIERSIANREFAVSEGSSSDNPAVIGRVVGTGEDVWSVMAVVSRGRDEKGRSVSMYRYFFCEGGENLRQILAWWENKGKLKFDPFQIRHIGEFNTFDVTGKTPIGIQKNILNLSCNTNEPKLLEPKEYDLQSTNELALKKVEQDKGISWAYNVEGLEKPWLFQVINPASEKAYQILEKAIKNTPQILAPVLIDEEAMKSAIRGLMNSSQVKRELVDVIVDALKKDTNVEYLHTLFDAQGAKTAIKQKIYSPQMVRLITLRAIVIPETILEFLIWLNVKPGKKLDENQTVSLEFQKAIVSDSLKDKLIDGIKFLLPELLNHPLQISPESTYWLLGESESAWYLCRREFIQEISDNLQSIYDNHKSHQKQKNIGLPEVLRKIANNSSRIYSNSSSIQLEEYINFAKLFSDLKEYSLSAYFYQISRGKVPKDIFQKVYLQRGSSSKTTIYGLKLKPEISWIILYFILQEVIVPFYVVIPLSIIFFTSGLFIGSKFLGQQFSKTQVPTNKEQSISQTKGSNDADNTPETIPGRDIGSLNNSTAKIKTDDKQLIENAIKEENFNKTTSSIAKIVSKIKNNRSVEDDIIINKIKQILNISDLNYARIDDESERMKLAEAIYNYQKQYFDNKANGYLTEGTEVFISLQEKVNQSLSNKKPK